MLKLVGESRFESIDIQYLNEEINLEVKASTLMKK